MVRAADVCLFQESGRLSREDVLQCLLGLGPLEASLYYSLLKKPATVSELSKRHKKDRTTVQKSVKKLAESGLVFRRTVPTRTRGYQYVYEALPKDKLKQKLKKNAQEWYKSVSKLIDAL